MRHAGSDGGTGEDAQGGRNKAGPGRSCNHSLPRNERHNSSDGRELRATIQPDWSRRAGSGSTVSGSAVRNLQKPLAVVFDAVVKSRAMFKPVSLFVGLRYTRARRYAPP